jgi:hypothetical protein
MAPLDADTLAALNRLLEDERAAVTIAAALINGATELAEREAFARMGGEQVLACCALRERLELAAAAVSGEIGGAVFPVLATDYYDERLRAYAYHLSHLNERAQALLLVVTTRETRRTLEDAYAAHAWAVAWCDRRAEEFAASRVASTRVPRQLALGAAWPLRETSEDTGTNGDGLSRLDQIEAATEVAQVENGYRAARGADAGAAGGAASSDAEQADQRGRDEE